MNRAIALTKCRQVLIYAGIFGMERLWQIMINNLNVLEQEGVFRYLLFDKHDLIEVYNKLVLVKDCSLFFSTEKSDITHAWEIITELFEDVSIESIKDMNFIVAKMENLKIC